MEVKNKVSQILFIDSLVSGLFFILANRYFSYLNNFFISHKLTLKHNEKLKSRKIIQQLFNEGKSFSNFPLRVIYLEVNQTASLQAGFAVKSKFFKKAVDRNRIKRLMRESYRTQKINLKTVLEENNRSLAVFFIYMGNELPAYKIISEKMESVLGQLETIVS